MIAFNATRSREIASRVLLADTAATRSKGLLGRMSMEPEEGLWIVPCPMIHTFFMKFAAARASDEDIRAIDVIFLDRELKVRRVMEDLKPWRMSPWVFSAHSVLELAGGSLKGGVQVGDRLEFR